MITVMKKDYIVPECYLIMSSVDRVLCASFDSNDYTENWQIDTEETI